jgi:hypothetical protein
MALQAQYFLIPRDVRDNYLSYHRAKRGATGRGCVMWLRLISVAALIARERQTKPRKARKRNA